MSKPIYILLTATIVAVFSAGCGSKSDASSSAAGPREETSNRTHPPRKLPFEPLKLRAPCEWLTPAEVEGIVGTLAGPPFRARNAENARPDDTGNACAYPIPGRNGSKVFVSIQVDPTGAAAVEQAAGMMKGLFAKELNNGASSKPAAPAPRTDGWDYVGGVGGISIWRVGHMAVSIGGGANFLLSKDKMNQVALLVRERIPDVPLADPNALPGADGPLNDPCSLLTRAEAESVLGKLQVAPFQSTESTPLADPEGVSCTFYAPGHHALVLTPTRSEGKAMFDMMRGGSNLVRSTVGGADAADPLDGPWDDAFEGPTGSLFFLKGDAVLEVSFRSSSTNIEGAAKLARQAITRL